MWALLAISLAFSAGPEVSVQTLSGEAVSGTVRELTTSRLVLDTSQGEVTLEADKLLRLKPKAAPAPAVGETDTSVLLTDGSRLLATAFTSQQKSAQATFQARR